MSEPIVQLKNVTKRIGSKTIVDHLTFDIPKGEVFGFLGPNGAGKTTTIRMMVGLMSITEGEVLIHGHSIRTEFEKAIRHVGAIVENPEMYKFLTGYQNLIHYARMIPGITKHRIEEVVELVGLKKRIHEKVKTYSLGMRQRLGVAQALLHKPSLLILDEPTNGLDPAGIRELRDYLRGLAKSEGISVCVSSHLLSEMELMCDRVAIIQQGKLIDVRQIRGESTENKELQVIFEIDQAASFVEKLAQTDKWKGTQVSDTQVELSLEKEQIPDLNRWAVENGFKVYGIRVATKSLEDQFLEITGSDQIA
ncbi:ABC transporter ATP-binding protein [Marinicrinis lubricantis]|uniref:ABC transporter ATP-binding protein n=1 Tax=Marinicrinis lubricantis TaxID=2086470 RepID=A0ABW1IR92_9BACL